ncbi:MAG: RNA recognition motif domain-containing protein [Candidatus Korobacteraceae bacterium]|jgi:RNA recognition motif-containing protein
MKNIYVGNLTFDASEDQVRGLFEAYGAVDKVSIITDRDTGQPRGFAFVEMTDDESALKAMEALNGTNLGGRNLTVNEARPKADRPRRDGGGGGGRGGYGGGRGGGGGGRGRSGGGGGGGGWGRY